MAACNDQRKAIQKQIVAEASVAAREFPDDPVLFLGGDWHPGVIGIAASKIAEQYWRPTFLYNNTDTTFKGSARSVPGFDVTAAMMQQADCFLKFGGHAAAGGFSFAAEHEARLRSGLNADAALLKQAQPDLWESKVYYDCQLGNGLVGLDLLEMIADLRPFGQGFEQPKFLLRGAFLGCRYLKDKQTGEDKHSVVMLGLEGASSVFYFSMKY